MCNILHFNVTESGGTLISHVDTQVESSDFLAHWKKGEMIR